MIITLTKADFSSCKIGTLTTFNVRKSTTIGATVNIIKTSVERAGYSSATTIATIVLDEANYEGHAIKVMMGSTDVSSWYSVGNVIVPANTPITSNITISVSATATSTGGGTGGDSEEPETPSVPTSTVWYTDVTNTSLSTECKLDNTSYGWAYSNDTDINAIKNKPINAVRFVTTSTSGKVTIGVADSFKSTTMTKTLQKEFTKSTNSKEIVTVIFDEAITLTGDQRLIFEPNTHADRKYVHFFGSITNHNGFYSRIPVDLDGGESWRNNLSNSIGISVGYVVSGGSDNGDSGSGDSNSGITWYTDYSSINHSGTCANDSGGWTYTNSDTEPIRNKPINYVKFATVSPSGSVRVGKASLNSETVTDIVTGSFTNNTGGATIVEVELSDTITLSDNEYIIFEPYTSSEYAFSSKKGKYSFKYMTSGGNGFLSRIPLDLEKGGATPWKNNAGMNIGWSVGYKQK